MLDKRLTLAKASMDHKGKQAEDVRRKLRSGYEAVQMAGAGRDDPDLPEKTEPHLQEQVLIVEGEGAEEAKKGEEAAEEEEEPTCLICLSTIQDRTLLPQCAHSLFCFDCILEWFRTGHKRCPLCCRDVERYVIHEIRSEDDYLRFYLPGTSSASTSELGLEEEGGAAATMRGMDLRAQQELRMTRGARRQLAARPTRRDNHKSSTRQDASRTNDGDAMNRWNTQLETRRKVYREGLFSLHIGSNRTSKLGAPPTPQQISQSSQLQSSLRHFLRREFLAICSILQHHSHEHQIGLRDRHHPPRDQRTSLDVDFLTTYTLSLLQHLDARSDETYRLLSNLLDESAAEDEASIVSLLVNELYAFLRFCAGPGRGGGRRIWEWDREVRYHSRGLWQQGTNCRHDRMNGREINRHDLRDRRDGRAQRASPQPSNPDLRAETELSMSSKKRRLDLVDERQGKIKNTREEDRSIDSAESDVDNDAEVSRERIRLQRSKLLDKLQVERTQQQQAGRLSSHDVAVHNGERRARLMEKLRKEREMYKVEPGRSSASRFVLSTEGDIEDSERRERELKEKILRVRLKSQT